MRFIVERRHYRDGRIHEPGDEVELPKGEKPAAWMKPVKGKAGGGAQSPASKPKTGADSGAEDRDDAEGDDGAADEAMI